MQKVTNILRELKKNHALFILLAPAFTIVLVLNYAPLAGLWVAFTRFRPIDGIFGSPFVGLDNFRFLFMTGTGFNITLNTITYNLTNLILLQTSSIIIAIFISEVRSGMFKKIIQTSIFMPHFISWVVAGMLVFNVFNFEFGVLNTLLKSLGLDPVNIYGNPPIWRILIPMFNNWKWVGYTSVIYLAAIAGVDQECYESADVDGANILQKNLYITIPSISKTVIIMCLLAVGRMLRGDFQMFFQLIRFNGQLFGSTDIIDTFVFRSLITGTDFGMSAAVTFYQSVLCFIIIVIVNGIVRKVDKDSSLF
ncbi:MAG: sugar ABC transporter permease [Oscillospiraceae bacterium]|jgi:putative aldouronate transport system permease protein|nr:sugar ABC transporter permease [Oscillospiraceae bacterium]